MFVEKRTESEQREHRVHKYTFCVRTKCVRTMCTAGNTAARILLHMSSFYRHLSGTYASYTATRTPLAPWLGDTQPGEERNQHSIAML